MAHDSVNRLAECLGDSYVVSSSGQTFQSSGGSGTVGVTTPGGCDWAAVSNVSWIAVTAGNAGDGNGTVGYTVASNPGGTRTGSVVMAGRVFTVTQLGIPDLSVAMTDSPDPAFVGDDLLYSVTIINRGPSVATGVVLTDDLPSSIAFVSVTPSQGRCSRILGRVTCSLGTLASGGVAQVRIVVVPGYAGKYGTKYQWKDETYNGIPISVGTPTDKSQTTAAYSLVDHVVVFATTGAQIHEIIDTDQGRASRLVDSSDFKATLADLPSDRLGYLYVNGRSLVANVKKEMATTPAMALALKNINDVNALQGIGATLSANGDGMLADLLVKLDQSKLSPATREALAHPGRADTIVSWVPKSSDAFLAITSLNKTIQSLLDQSGNEASVKAGTDAIGLTGPGGVLPHLTGDAGLEVGFASNGIPAGAIVLGTNDAKSMNAFFAKLLVLADGAIGSSLLGAGSSFGSPSPPVTPASHTTTTNYRGVVITSWTSPALGGLGAGALSPSYAVLDGMGILASTPAEVKAIIDTHKDAASIASDTTYKSASTASLASPSGIIYLDIAKLVDAIRKSPLGSQAGLGSGSTLSATVGPVKAVILTAASQADRATERFFVIVR